MNIKAWLLSTATMVLLPLEAAAQVTSDPSAGQAVGVEEIVVTAQRREERLQEVPITVTAATGARLERAGVTSAVDLQNIAPGLQMAAVRHNIQPYLRGVGSQNTSPGEEGSIAVYIDGVYVNYMAAATFGLLNVERVEVLNGPQGTLFGRNATGGLINIITKKPTFEARGDVDLSYANYNAASTKLYMNAPLGENIAANLSVYYFNQAEGFGTNLLTGDDVNTKEEASISGKVLWNSPWGTEFLLQADWGQFKSDIGTARSVYPGTSLIGGIGPNGGPFDSQSNNSNTGNIIYGGASLRASHDLGWADATFLTAYRRVREKIDFDQDGGPLNTAFLISRVPDDTIQHELTLAGDTGAISWTAGAFYYRAWAGYQPQYNLSAASTVYRESYLRTEAYALFGQATYSVTPNTKITAGYRASKDRRQVSGFQRTLPSGALTLVASQKASFSEPAWRLAIDHEISPSVMAYLSRSRGFKSGTFSATSFQNAAVRPETLDATEAGLKSTILDGSLLLNISAFEYNYKDIQLAQIIGGVSSRLLNAAQGKPRGVNVDVSFREQVGVGTLAVNASAAWMRAKYESFPGAPSATPRPGGGNIQGVIDATGNRMIRAPAFTSNVSVDYEFPLADGVFGVTGIWARNSGFFTDPDNTIRQPRFDVLNVRARYQIDNLEFYAFGQNLTDEVYLSSLSHSNLGDLATYGTPRTYGVGIKVGF